jgi:CheY-like chemotaxis protein
MKSLSTVRKFNQPARKIMIYDNSIHKYQGLISSLEKEGWEIEAYNDKLNAISQIRSFQPALVIMNLFMSNSSNISLIRDIKQLEKRTEIKIIVVTSHYSEENIKKSILAGASDFIVEPFDTKLLQERLKFQFQDKAIFQVDDLKVEESQLQNCFNLIYECQRILAEFEDAQSALFNCLKHISKFCSASRINIMLAELDKTNAIVVASSDDENFQNKAVNLDRYPEVREVLIKNNIIYIKDILSNPLTENIKKEVKSIEISGLMVLPIRHRKNTVGTLNIRLASNSIVPSEVDLKALFIIAMAMAPKIAAKKLMREKNDSLS